MRNLKKTFMAIVFPAVLGLLAGLAISGWIYVSVMFIYDVWVHVNGAH